MLQKIKNKLRQIRRNYLNQNLVKKLVDSAISHSSEQKIYIFQTPTHSNIGDHAIAEAQVDFLKYYFPDHQIIEINQSLMISFLKRYAHIITKNDIITLHGGGNFGNAYLKEERLRRAVVEAMPDNKIIIFPQTVYYTDNAQGRVELKITQDLFSKHKDLTITAREIVSYELMKKYFPNSKVIITPDIVLFTSKIAPSIRANGLEVIRADEESILSKTDKAQLHQLLISKFQSVIVSDMHVEHFRSVTTISERKAILEAKFAQFRNAKVVITDRLHGMVLAAITGTPCVVFSNYNQKVLGTYEWIKDLPYIRFVNNISEAKVAFSELLELGDFIPYDNVKMRNLYLPLRNAIDGK